MPYSGNSAIKKQILLQFSILEWPSLYLLLLLLLLLLL